MIILLGLLISTPGVFGSVGFDFITGPENCIGNEFFNSAARLCIECGENTTTTDRKLHFNSSLLYFVKGV